MVNAKEFVLSKLDVPSMWSVMFPQWKPDVNVECPLAEDRHENGRDSNPSMSLSTDGRVFCHSCGYKASSPIGLIEDMEGISFKRACRLVYSRFVAPLVPENKVKEWAERLPREKLVMARLDGRRGLQAKILAKWQIGFDGGRLTIPVRNECGWTVNVRRYDILGKFGPKLKMVSYKKGYGTAKLWPIENLKEQELFLCEGELDALLLMQAGYAAVTVSGGVNTWREDWSKKFAGKNVWIVPDMDKIGLKGARDKFKSISRYAKSVTILKLPVTGKKSEKDVTDWVLAQEGDLSKLKELEILEENESAENEAMAPDESTILSPLDDMSKKELVNVDRGNAVVTWLLTRGTFYKNQYSQHFYALHGGTTFPMGPREERFIGLLASIHPLLNQASSSGRFIIQHVLNKGMELSEQSTSAYFSVISKECIWIYAKEDTILKVERNGKRSLIRNGTNEDRILLECPPDNKPFTPVMDADVGKSVREFHDLVGCNIPCDPFDRLLVEVWVLMAIFFTDYTRVRPILRFSANTATGKSTSSKLLSYLTYGDEVLNQSSTSAANYVLSEKSPLLFLDNLEARNMTADLEQFLLGAATGATRSKRKMDTDSGLVMHRLKAMVCANGIEPFQVRELNSRVVEVQLNLDKYGRHNFHEVQLFNTLKKRRGFILSGLSKLMAMRVLPRMARGEVQRISKGLGSHSKRRFNESLALMSIILDALFPYIGTVKVGSPKEVTKKWLKSMRISSEEQDLGTNPVLYYLEQLVQRNEQLLDLVTRVVRDKNGVHFRCSTTDLLSDFRRVARAEGTKCPWESERHLGTRIADADEILKKAGWIRIQKVISGKRYYEYSKNKATAGNKKRKRRKVRINPKRRVS